MKRGGFARKVYVPAPVAPLRALSSPPNYAGATTGGPVIKPIATRPGKRTPTVAERAWLDWIVARGCIACWLDGLGFVAPCVHHLLRGGRRIGHLHSIPLCDPGHHQNGQARGLISRHPWKARFELRYGSEEYLLELLQAEYQRQKGGVALPSWAQPAINSGVTA